MKILLPLLMTVCSFTLSNAQPDDLPSRKFPAFPGAEGWGAYTPGGRGGKVFVVTSLADYRPGKEPVIHGSLREAVESKGPRMVVFRVSGYIDLKDQLEIDEPFITIAGQSAPGDGICLRYYSLGIKTHDVVLRYLRCRPGDTVGKEMDAISCNGHNVIIDHCSTSFAIDETLSTNGESGNLTVQWCMITESLNESVHHKGGHGYGSLISGTRPITYHHNLYAFHRSRNPRPGIGRLDFRNNVIVGWGDWAGYCGNDLLKLNYIGNYLRPAAYSKDREFAFRPGGPNVRIFVAGNLFAPRPEAEADNVLLIRPPEKMTAEQVRVTMIVPTPFPSASVTTEKPDVAYRHVLEEVGAIRPVRDAIDSRVIDLVRTEKGKIINSQKEVGGWPDLKAAEAPADGDSDGMPDDWEKSAGLDPADPADAALDLNRDGFTNIEAFLNGLDPKTPFEWIYPPEVSIGDSNNFVTSARVSMRTMTPNAEVRFTLDGTEPTDASEAYTESIEITRTTMVRAKAFRRGDASHVTNQLFEHLPMREAVKLEGAVQGIDYNYYENGEWRGFPDWDSLKVVKNGITDNIGITPTDRVAGYGLKFTGYIGVPADGTYTFYLRSNELSLLKIDGETIAMSQSRKREHSGQISLKAGFHAIEASCYFPTEGPERTLEVSYEGPGITKQLIPGSALFRAAMGAVKKTSSNEESDDDGMAAYEKDYEFKRAKGERAAMIAADGKAWRIGNTLHLLLKGDQVKSYADPAERQDYTWGYAFRGYSKRHGFHTVEQDLHEGSRFLLVDAETGIETEIDALPVFSPNGKRFVTASLGEYSRNRLMVWQATRPQPKVEWTLNGDEEAGSSDKWGPQNASWKDDREIIYEKKRYGTDYREPGEIQTVRLTDGGWK